MQRSIGTIENLCIDCGLKLTPENSPPSVFNSSRRICRECDTKRARTRRTKEWMLIYLTMQNQNLRLKN